MHDFGQFCYLDVQKTGSSFISTFLRQHALVPVERFKKHGRIEKQRHMGEGKFFFISSREPLELYKSLYSFGMREKGALHKILLKRDPNFASFYDGTSTGFSNWLRFILDPANVKELGQGFRPREAKLYGLMTYRFLVLSFYRPSEVLPGIMSKQQLLDTYEKSKIHSAVVQNESLNEGMAALIEGPLRPYIREPDAAAAELRSTAKRVNVSPRADGLELDDELLDLLWQREWFYAEVLGYKTAR